MSKTDKERNRIQDEFDEIQSENGEFDLSKHLARPEDLPDLGEIEIYDYDYSNPVKITPNNVTVNDLFGSSISMTPDGTILVVSSPGYDNGKGIIYAYKKQTLWETWLSIPLNGQEGEYPRHARSPRLCGGHLPHVDGC